MPVSLSLILVVSHHGSIEIATPWGDPEFMDNVNRMTRGHPVIMGRGTWDLLPRDNPPREIRPFKESLNMILTRNLVSTLYSAQGERAKDKWGMCESLDSALSQLDMHASSPQRAFVIGGIDLSEETLRRTNCTDIHAFFLQVNRRTVHYTNAHDDLIKPNGFELFEERESQNKQFTMFHFKR